MSRITENSFVSVGVLVMIAGGIFWLSSLYSLASTTADRVTQIERRQDQYLDDIQLIKEDLAVIKQILKKHRE